MCHRQMRIPSIALVLFVTTCSSTGWSADNTVVDATVPMVSSNPVAPPFAQARVRPVHESYHAQWYRSQHAWQDQFIDNYPELKAQRYSSRHPDSWIRKQVLGTKGWFAYISGSGPAIWNRN